MQMAQGAIVQAQQIIQEKDTKIADQKLTIDDLRQDKIELREKVSEQKNSIDSLTKTNLEQAEKIHQVSDKYLGLKTHFVDLVTLHQEDYPDYVPVVDLAGLDLNL